MRYFGKRTGAISWTHKIIFVEYVHISHDRLRFREMVLDDKHETNYCKVLHAGTFLDLIFLIYSYD